VTPLPLVELDLPNTPSTSPLVAVEIPAIAAAQVVASAERTSNLNRLEGLVVPIPTLPVLVL
jgi:hypothetical protein